MVAVPSGQPGPWRPDLAAALQPLLPELADEVIAAIGAEVPIYAQPLEGNFGRGVRRGVQGALSGFVELVEGHGSVEATTRRDVSRELGRGEVRQGRTLDALLAAYRVGARVTWRRLGEAASALGLSGSELVHLGDLLFAAIDALSSAAAEGYATEQSERAGEQGRRRRYLAELLLGGSASAVTLDVTAEGADWNPPTRLSAVTTPLASAAVLRPLAVDPAVLLHSGDGVHVALVEDADSPPRRATLARLLAGQAPIAVGPAVPWREAAGSLARARAALELVVVGVLQSDGPVWTGDVLVPLVVHADPGLAAELAARLLAPLDGLPESTATRLAETLAAWLALQGARAAVAERLHVHPQTVRYRVGQLRELFGDALDDPEQRFALELALRVRGAGSPSRSHGSAR